MSVAKLTASAYEPAMFRNGLDADYNRRVYKPRATTTTENANVYSKG